MFNPSAFGKPPRPSKISAKSVNTVNLGLQYHESGLEGHTYPLSNALGGSTHHLAKLAGTRRKERSERPASANKGGYSSHQLSNLPYSSAKQRQSKPNVTGAIGYSPSQSCSSNSVSPSSDSEKRLWKNQESGKIPKTQVYLPGDRVVFAESSSAPGVPIIYRLDEEKQKNPDKLNLDRRKLNVCPILEGEESLRLLNFQHNLIRKIQHLSLLKKLIFLDLYDNQLEEISGLNSLKALRVLMLGKNRIRKIQNLQDLTMLDVLDLHGNKISSLEHLSHLKQLRVLNLAGNEITVVENLTGLDSLSELNLRRNYIHTVNGMDSLLCLQRLFLSFNEIKSYDDMSCLNKSHLIELSVDGNPFANSSGYKQSILQNIPSLKQLDMKRLSEEEKRIASVMARKEEERRREQERISTLKEKRRLAINNAQCQWNRHLTKDKDYSTSAESEHDFDAPSLKSGNASRNSSVSSEISSRHDKNFKDFTASHLAELEGGCLNLYGAGSLSALDKNWGEKASTTIKTVLFKYIDLEDIVPHLSKLHLRFPHLSTLKFEMTNICSLGDINVLACLQRLDHLDISDDGNSVVSLSLWKPYVTFRLSHLKLKTINGKQITNADVVRAEKLFGPTSHMTSSSLSQTRLLLLIGKRQFNADDMSKAGLFYPGHTRKSKTDIAERQDFAKHYIRDILHTAIMVNSKQAALDNIMPQLFADLVSKYYKEISNVDAYCENALENIKKSVDIVT